MLLEYTAKGLTVIGWREGFRYLIPSLNDHVDLLPLSLYESHFFRCKCVAFNLVYPITMPPKKPQQTKAEAQQVMD